MRLLSFLFAAVLGLAAFGSSAPTSLDTRISNAEALKGVGVLPDETGDTVGCSFKSKRDANSCDVAE